MMSWRRALIRMLNVAFILSVVVVASGCENFGMPSSDNDSVYKNQIAAESSATTGNYNWFVGRWLIQGTPNSYGPSGSDVRAISVTQSNLTIEKQGELAAEAPEFNQSGSNYSGNCLYLIRTSSFGMDSGVLVMNTRSYQLVNDPTNSYDCAAQINHINDVISRYHSNEIYEVGTLTTYGSNGFQLSPSGFSMGNPRTYERQ